ncbi:hypothetical protein [Zavarzinella formosa]|uniref:hypothetical protein n=1 Tax=Zavarzinella formosa TaxID=360055 RepID=UPI0002F16792|nr:hypothetical protein [Zavarzinella formosa]
MLLAFWPLDWSCSGFCFFSFLIFAWFGWAACSAAESAADLAKKALQNEAVQEIGKDAVASWLESFFMK